MLVHHVAATRQQPKIPSPPSPQKIQQIKPNQPITTTKKKKKIRNLTFPTALSAAGNGHHVMTSRAKDLVPLIPSKDLFLLAWITQAKPCSDRFLKVKIGGRVLSPFKEIWRQWKRTSYHVSTECGCPASSRKAINHLPNTCHGHQITTEKLFFFYHNCPFKMHHGC